MNPMKHLPGLLEGQRARGRGGLVKSVSVLLLGSLVQGIVVAQAAGELGRHAGSVEVIFCEFALLVGNVFVSMERPLCLISH